MFCAKLTKVPSHARKQHRTNMEAATKALDAKELVAKMLECIESRSAESSSSSSNENGENGTEKLTKLKLLLTQSITEIGRLMAQTVKDVVMNAAGSAGGKNYLVVNDAQLLEPRGRFNVTLSSEGMLLEGKQVTCFVPWIKISHTACVPSNASSKKEGEELLTLLLSEPVKCNNKDLKTLVWNLSKAPGKDLTVSHESSSTPIIGTEHTVVAALVGLCTNMPVVTPQKELFQSIAAQKPFLRCYKGIQEGAIYPLQNGILFVKPALFITTENIASLSAGRGGGAGNTRYVDLVIETADGKSHEFTNIERDELPAIQIYVKGYLEARKKQEEKEKAKKQQAKSLLAESNAMKVDGVKEEGTEEEEDEEEEEGEEGDDDEDSDDDDDDFDPDASDDDGSEFHSEGSNDGSDDDDDDDGGSDSDLEEAKGAAKKKTKASKHAHGSSSSDVSKELSTDTTQQPQPRAKRAAAAVAEKKVAEELKAAEMAALAAAGATNATTASAAAGTTNVAARGSTISSSSSPGNNTTKQQVVKQEVKVEATAEIKKEVKVDVVESSDNNTSSSHKRSYTEMDENEKKKEETEEMMVDVELQVKPKESQVDGIRENQNMDVKLENAEPNHLQNVAENAGSACHGGGHEGTSSSSKRVKVEGNESSSSSSSTSAVLEGSKTEM